MFFKPALQFFTAESAGERLQWWFEKEDLLIKH